MTNIPDQKIPTPPANGGFDLNNPTIISLLYLGSFITGITGLVGIVLAYVWRGDQEPWAASHFTFLIRTFWIGLIASIVSAILTIILIGIPMLIAVSVWFAVRSVVSIVKAQRREPMPNPETLWI